MASLSFGLVLLSLMLIASETSALKCWRCSSDSSNSEFCKERLDLTLLTPQQTRWNFVECSPPKDPKNIYGQTMVSRCRMQIQSIYGQKVYSRHCVVEPETDDANACLVRSVLPEVKILACETCQTDGCNDFISEKPAELNVAGSSAGIKTTLLLQLFTFVFGIVWLLYGNNKC